MKIVLDTNVLVSGIFFTGPPYRILDAFRKGAFQIVISDEIFTEYCRVVDELKDKFEGVDARSALEMILSVSKVVAPEELPARVCDDPDDDKFLAAAITGRANIVVSGDKHLHRVSGYRNVVVLSPRSFTDQYL